MKARGFAALFVLVLAVHMVLLGAVPRRPALPEQDRKATWSARAVAAPVPSVTTTSAPGSASDNAAPSAARPPSARNTAAVPPAVVKSAIEAGAEPGPVAAQAPAVPGPDPSTAATIDPARWIVPVEATVAAAHAAVNARAAAPMLPVAVPGSVSLRYDVTAFTRQHRWQGQGHLQWHQDGDRYEARMEVAALLLPTRTQTSTGRITADGLVPIRFSDKSRSEEATHFLREQGRISFSSNRPDVALAAGAQDRLSVLLQLGALIAGRPARFPAGSSIALQTAGTREAETWLFTVEGPETLALPGGRVPALKLIRMPRKEFDLKVELWLAPGMDYVPVRLRLTQPNGDWADQQWSSTDKG